MDRNTALIITVLTVFLCAVPGLILCCVGAAALLFAPEAGSGERVVLIFASLMVFIGFAVSLIPVGFGVFALRQKVESPSTPVVVVDEDLPPAI